MKSSGTLDLVTGKVNFTEIGLKRFWNHVNKHGPIPKHRPELGKCWEWTLARDANGYGVVSFHNKQARCHRVMWVIHHGEIASGMFILHHCDNPSCCRLDHLYEGTPQQNMGDKYKRKRDNTAVGERTRFAKLIGSQVLELRRRSSLGENLKKLAKEFHITLSNLRYILARKTWRHI